LSRNDRSFLQSAFNEAMQNQKQNIIQKADRPSVCFFTMFCCDGSRGARDTLAEGKKVSQAKSWLKGRKNKEKVEFYPKTVKKSRKLWSKVVDKGNFIVVE